MKIKGVKTIAEYKEIQNEKVQKWVDDNFNKKTITWKWVTASTIEIKDKFNDTLIIDINEIE